MLFAPRKLRRWSTENEQHFWYLRSAEHHASAPDMHKSFLFVVNVASLPFSEVDSVDHPKSILRHKQIRQMAARVNTHVTPLLYCLISLPMFGFLDLRLVSAFHCTSST